MRIVYLHEFLGEFSALDRAAQQRIRKKLDEMSRSDFHSFPHQPLKGSQFKGFFKHRAGDWRLIYQVRGEEVCFVTLGHRSDVYR